MAYAVLMGTKTAIAALAAEAKKYESSLHVAANAIGLLIESEAKKLITSGYYAPAIDTGRMRNSVTFNVINDGLKGVFVEIGTSVYYAVHVHEGTAFGMKPRPFLTDALNNQKENAEKIIIAAMR